MKWPAHYGPQEMRPVRDALHEANEHLQAAKTLLGWVYGWHSSHCLGRDGLDGLLKALRCMDESRTASRDYITAPFD